MTDVPGRVPPADPWNITLTHQLRHPWWYDADDGCESWHVSADIYDEGGTDVESHVGDMRLVAVDAYETRDPFALLDGESADLGTIAEVIFEPRTGDLNPDFEERIGAIGSRILILDSVRLTLEWRGFGLGVLLAGTAITRLSGGARAAVCYPAPIRESDSEEITPAADEHAVIKLAKVGANLGFEHFRNGVHLLDLNLVTPR